MAHRTSCFTLWWSDVEVLWRPLLGWRAVLGVGAAALLRGVVQHDGWGGVAGGVVRS